MRIYRMPIDTEIRQKRHQAIRDILSRQPVARQAQLVALLREQGIRATQSSVSRDLKQLGITKLDNGYAEPQRDTAGDGRELAMVAEFVRNIQAAGPHLTVISTAVGAAQRVAVSLDRSGWPEIVGTLSGDDTIFVATCSAAEQRQLIARLRTLFPG